MEITFTRWENKNDLFRRSLIYIVKYNATEKDRQENTNVLLFDVTSGLYNIQLPYHSNLNGIGLDLTRSLEVKYDGGIGHTIHDFLLL